ncbi:MAG: lipid-A-disaccharide synthase [Acidobacteriia bacterium]|nr:lipid-A-disaccharide synthase [Terriglobia bacterium]
MPAMTPTPILLSAGEASGEMYAAKLAAALRRRADVALFGMGGARMREAGVEIVTDYSEVAVVGITEVLRHLPSLLRAMQRLVSEAARRRPPLAVLTDFPGFHLRLARKLLPRGVRNVYFVCPQFWAWRPWRVRILRRRFALGLCIFPFEEKFFGDAGVPVEFIGHPLVGEVRAAQSREAFCRSHGLDAARPIVTLLPGSRSSEMARHLPVLREACALIRQSVPAAQFVLAAAPESDCEALRRGWPREFPLRVVEGQTYDAMAAADAAIVSSGTATVEAALLDAPMVVIYRVSALTALLAKPFVRTPFFSMVNLIAGRRVVPELIQKDCTPQRVAHEVLRLLQQDAARAELRRGLAEVRERLGPPGAIERAADAIVRMLRAKPGNAS